MEWKFAVHQSNQHPGPCPEEKVEELSKFLIRNKYVPFAWTSKGKTIVRQNKYKYGTDWNHQAIIWLHQPSLPSELKTKHKINMDLEFE